VLQILLVILLVELLLRMVGTILQRLFRIFRLNEGGALKDQGIVPLALI